MKAGNFLLERTPAYSSGPQTLCADALRMYLPKTATLLSGLPAFQHPDFAARLSESVSRYARTFRSITRCLSNATIVAVGVPCDEFSWNDVQVAGMQVSAICCTRDADANATRSELLSSDSTGNYIDCGHKLVALLGVKDLIVVDTPDALLIADRRRAQQVGDIVKLLEKNGREELL